MFSFEKLEVYQKAYIANQKVYRLLKSNNSIPSYVRNQFGRASLSIMLNIAEGSAKFSKKDRRNFFVTARGSTYECSSLITFLHNEGELEEEVKEELTNTYIEISRILYTMIRNLEKSS